MKTLLLLCLLASPSFSQESLYVWDGSVVDIVPVEGLYGRVIFKNVISNSAYEFAFNIDYNGTKIFFMLLSSFEGTDDALIIYPPKGILATPEMIIVPDGQVGTIDLEYVLG